MSYKYGIHGLGEVNNMTLYNRYQPALNGWRFRKDWAGFEVTRGNYVTNFWLDDIMFMIADGKFVTIGNSPGPDPNTPVWIYGSPDLVARIYTDRGVYPYGRSTAYQNKLKASWGEIADIINSLDPGDRIFGFCFQSMELSTGDQGTIKGTIQRVTINGVQQPNPSSYIIPDAEWNQIKRTNLWPAHYNESISALMHPMYNIGNDGDNYDFVTETFPGAWMKVGYPTHNYNIPGEAGQQQMIQSMRFAADNDSRFQAELDQVDGAPWWQLSPKRNLRTLVVSAIAHGMDIMNLSLGTLNNTFGTDISLMNWANKYFGFRKPQDTNKGFVQFRKCIDLAVDDPAAPLSTYPLINPSQLSNYNREVQNIQNNSSYGTYQKMWLITGKKVKYHNPARVTALREAYPDAMYQPLDQDQDINGYEMDFGIDMIPGSYEKFVHVINQNSTTKPYWRQGPVNSYYGRNGLGFDVVNGKDTISLYEDFTGNFNYQVSILVRYLDRGTGLWSLHYHNGTAEAVAGVIGCGNTAQWKEAVFNIQNYDGGRKLTGGAHFTISYESGTDTQIFDAVEFELIAINTPTNTPPTADAGTNQTITAPESTVNLTGSGNDPDGTIVGYLWTKISGVGGIIANPTSQNTSVTDLQTGEYVFQLEVTDNDGAKGTNTVTITVNPGAPVANAGSNQTITLPTSSVTLSAALSQAISGTITGYAWTKLSGGSATIVSPSSVSTSVTGLTAGTYIFQVEVTNSYGLTAVSSTVVIVNSAPPVNQAPTANAGNDQTLVNVTTATLNGAGSDPDGSIVGYLWTKISGTGGGITSPTSANTGLTGLSVGEYVYQLRVQDNAGAFGYDTVTITITEPAVIDPVANAGADQTIQLPTSSVNVDGSASYDPDGTITAQLWVIREQPTGAAANIVDPNALVTEINNLIVPGTYIFRLRVQDNDGNIKGDAMTVTVLPPNAPPIVQISTPDTTLTLPDNSINIVANASDGDGSITGVIWEQLEGEPATIESPLTANTTISDLQAGINRFRLTAQDDLGATNSAEITITVNNPELSTDYLKNVIITDPESYELAGGILVNAATLPLQVTENMVSEDPANSTITLQYVDTGVGTFHVNCIRCNNRSKRVLSVRKANTGNVVTISVTVVKFKFGQSLPGEADFTITDAQETLFKLVSFVNNTIQQQQTAN